MVSDYIRDSQEIDRRHVPPISEDIRGSGGIEYRTDSTIAPPPKPAIFFNERFMAARHKEIYY